LVLGSGISVSRGLPNWNSLAQDLWREAFGRRRSPWQTTSEAKSPREVPQFLPIVFELAYKKLGEEKFLKALRTNLYRNAQPWNRRFSESHETLAVLARLVVQEFKRGRNRRIERIVTFNADDVLEQAVFALSPVPYKPRGNVISVVAQPSSVVERDDRGEPIGVYYIHGFLPKSMKRYAYQGDRLVFTDAQYWSTSATALAFANRVMLSALSESRCVFIGLSMTDINLLRWLALRTLEWDRDVDELQRHGQKEELPGDELARTTNEILVDFVRIAFYQHFWIRPGSDDPTGFLSKFLSTRGIQTVELNNWAGPHFQQLMQKCFP
jgi:hypothetical protein